MTINSFTNYFDAVIQNNVEIVLGDIMFMFKNSARPLCRCKSKENLSVLKLDIFL